MEVEASGAPWTGCKSGRHCSRGGEAEERHFLMSLISEELGSDIKQHRCKAKTCIFF